MIPVYLTPTSPSNIHHDAVSVQGTTVQQHLNEPKHPPCQPSVVPSCRSYIPDQPWPVGRRNGFRGIDSNINMIGS